MNWFAPDSKRLAKKDTDNDVFKFLLQNTVNERYMYEYFNSHHAQWELLEQY